MGVYGAILGDIAGMPYEYRNGIALVQQTGEYDLFNNKEQTFTDDTIMTIAIADALLSGSEDFGHYMRKWGRRYPISGYGWNFSKWLKSDTMEGYNSCGNGSAMRVSSCGIFAKDEEDALRLGRCSALPTHDHIEGIKGAETVALAIYMANNKATKEELYDLFLEKYPSSKYKYGVDIKTSDYKSIITFDETCQNSVPVAFRCFYETNSFDECMKLINSMLIDTDTIGAIAGSICEEYYGYCYSKEQDDKLVKSYLTDDLYEVAQYFKGMR